MKDKSKGDRKTIPTAASSMIKCCGGKKVTKKYCGSIGKDVPTVNKFFTTDTWFKDNHGPIPYP